MTNIITSLISLVFPFLVTYRAVMCQLKITRVILRIHEEVVLVVLDEKTMKTEVKA